MFNEKETESWLNEASTTNENVKVTKLHIAAQNNDLSALNSAINEGVDLNAVTEDGWTALHFAAFRGYTDVVKALLAAGINVNIQGNFYHRTALHYAADRGYLEVVKELLKKNADTKILDKSEKTAFDVANQKGFKEIADLLKSKH